MTDGVFTIPLIDDLCLDDFEPACAPAGRATIASANISHANGNGSGALARDSSPSILGGKCQASFIAGPENRLLAEAVDSLLRESPSPYNPLVLCGAPGTGKSHVARGIARHWRAQDRDVLYTNGADFARGLAAAIENGATTGWRARHRDTALFVLEDVTQLSGKTAAIHELLHTIDAIQTQEGQVVLTTRLPPERISGITTALAGRFVGGLVVQLSPPAAAARLALVERFALFREIALPAGAARQLADGFAVTAPELFGAVTELAVECSLDGEPIETDRVRAFLAASRRAGMVRPSIRSIAALSAKYFNLKLAELTSPTRRRAVVQARNVAVYLARELSGRSLEQLGEFFGGRDHTTILHGYRTVETRARTDPAVRRALAELRSMIAHG